MDRVLYGWQVQLQDDQGTMRTREVYAYWSSDHECTAEGVGSAAKASLFMESGKTRQYAPISIRRL